MRARCPDFSAETAAGPRGRLDRGAVAGRSRRPPGRDHRPGRAQDDDQRAQLGRAGLHGGLRGRAVTALDQRGRRARLNCMDAVRRTPGVHQPGGQALPSGRAARHAGASGRAGGTSTRSTSWWTAARSPPPVRLRPLLLTTTPASCSPAGADPTSTFPSWRATSRPGSGTRSSRPRSGRWACPRAPSGPRCWWRRYWPRSRWTRSCTSFARMPPGSTPADGTTSSASSRISGHRPEFVLPDRAQVTMTVPFMRAYTELLVRTCHRRGPTPSAGWRPSSPAGGTRR